MKQNNSLNCKSIFLYYFEVTLNPVGNGIQFISGTGGRKELLTDVTAPAVFSYITQEDNILNYCRILLNAQGKDFIM